MPKKVVIDFEANTRNTMRDISLIANQFVTVYTEEEVNKLIKAYCKKYKNYCDLPPYKMKRSRVLKCLV